VNEAEIDDKPDAEGSDPLGPWQFSLGGLILFTTAFAVWMSLAGAVAVREGGDSLIEAVNLALLATMVAGLWRTFAKAGLPAWGAIVPIYNVVLVVRLAGWSSREALYLLIPVLNVVVLVVVSLEIAHRFGRGKLFGIGLAILPHAFYPILGFGRDQYDPSPR